MSNDKWEKLRTTRPQLWERRQKLIESIQDSIEHVRIARGDPPAEVMQEREEMAREMLGDLAQEIESHEDGSVTVHLAKIN